MKNWVRKKANRATLADVARLARVSTASVSRLPEFPRQGQSRESERELRPRSGNWVIRHTSADAHLLRTALTRWARSSRPWRMQSSRAGFRLWRKAFRPAALPFWLPPPTTTLFARPLRSKRCSSAVSTVSCSSERLAPRNLRSVAEGRSSVCPCLEPQLRRPAFQCRLRQPRRCSIHDGVRIECRPPAD